MSNQTDNTTTEAALEACPFCGSHAHVRETKAHGALPVYWVECVICEIGTKYSESPKAAAATWNTRTSAAASLAATPEDDQRDLLRDAGAILVVNEGETGARVEIRFAELEDAQRLHKTLVQSRAATPAGPQDEARPIRCVLCDHYGNAANGQCQEIGTVVVQGGEAVTRCGCKCVFPGAAKPSGAAIAAVKELNTLGYLDHDLLVEVSDERLAQVVAVISRYVTAEAKTELLTINGTTHKVESEVADAVDTLMDVVEDLTEPETLTPTTHYKNIKHGDPICFGFYKASMDSNEVDCEACLSIIRQRQGMDLHGWVD